jgi:hypothetical protein
MTNEELKDLSVVLTSWMARLKATGDNFDQK